MKGQIRQIKKEVLDITGSQILELLKAASIIPENAKNVEITFMVGSGGDYSGMTLDMDNEVLKVSFQTEEYKEWEFFPKWEKTEKLYAVSSAGGDLGDIFLGTIEQFRDCFCGNKISSFEELVFHAKGIHGDDVVVSEVN